MQLNNETFDKVKSLFKTPYNSIEYCGVYYNNTVGFKLYSVDKNNIETAGILVHINQNFTIHKVERLKQIWGKFKGRVITEYLPIHPEGSKTLLYKVFYKLVKE